MKSVYRVVLMVMVLGVFVTGSGHAQNAYWTAEVGAFSSDKSSFDTGVTLEGAYGVPITTFLSSLEEKALWSKVWLEAGLAYSHAEFDEPTVEGEVDVVPVTFSGLIRHPLNSNFGVYAGVGLGIYYVRLEAGGNTDDSIELGRHIEGGVEYSFTDKFAATAALKWAKVDKDAAGGLNVNFGIRYSF